MGGHFRPRYRLGDGRLTWPAWAFHTRSCLPGRPCCCPSVGLLRVLSLAKLLLGKSSPILLGFPGQREWDGTISFRFKTFQDMQLDMFFWGPPIEGQVSILNHSPAKNYGSASELWPYPELWPTLGYGTTWARTLPQMGPTMIYNLYTPQVNFQNFHSKALVLLWRFTWSIFLAPPLISYLKPRWKLKSVPFYQAFLLVLIKPFSV